jgi:hypothetical protein
MRLLNTKTGGKFKQMKRWLRSHGVLPPSQSVMSSSHSLVMTMHPLTAPVLVFVPGVGVI